MNRIRPSERQRPDFLGGVPLILADGQEWCFPKPRVRLRGDLGPRGYRTVIRLDGQADDYQVLLDRLEECRAFYRNLAHLSEDEAGRTLMAHPEMSPVGTELAIARRLLQRNYDLTDEEACTLIEFGLDPDDDPAGYELRRAVMDIAEGNGPKRSGDGSESSI